MKTFAPILTVFLVLAVSACQSTRIDTLPGHVSLRVAGTPEVRADGVRALLWFDVPDGYAESIQRITMSHTPGWVGVETHRQPMWAPDFQSAKFTTEPWYVERLNTVSPGRTEDCPWVTVPGVFKGVCMIDGWLDESGMPVGNALYFKLGGKQGGKIIEENVDAATRYRLEAWSAYMPGNPRPGAAFLRITCVDTGHFLEWPGE